jgi:HD-GYP domain-containing protein (c-di-GMP phosphodiesterase class II)
MTAPSEYYDLVRHLVSALNGRRIYPPRHPALERTLARIEQALHGLMVSRDEVQLGVLGTHLLADGLPWEEQGESYTALSRELKSHGIDKLTFQRGFSRNDLENLLEVLVGDRARGDMPGGLQAGGEPISVAHLLAGRGVSRIRVANLDLDLEKKEEAPPAETTGDQGAYGEAMEGMKETLECARDGRLIRVKQVQGLVEMLMEHMQRDPGPLLMLTALKSHSDYTFTHTVNVAILALAMVQTISRDPDVIRDYGIAAMMHDLGKMRIPTEILDKRGKLTEGEFDVIRRHPVDTLQILRETPGSSDLTLVVGFEHHRRFDQTGYPVLKRPLPQHFASRLCTIADCYDAMRSNRSYQQEMPPEQAMEVLRQQSEKMFDPALVSLFIRMMGAYPPGTRVRLDSGEEAMVLRVNPEDPFRPIVRILGDAGGASESLRLVNLAERGPKRGEYLRSVRESILDSRVNS